MSEDRAKDEHAKNAAEATPPAGEPRAGESDEAAHERVGISDFMRRAVHAGFEAASRSKDDVLRVAATEIRAWLDRLDLEAELGKALAKMVVEVKTEIRFRPACGGTPARDVTHEVRIKSDGKE